MAGIRASPKHYLAILAFIIVTIVLFHRTGSLIQETKGILTLMQAKATTIHSTVSLMPPCGETCNYNIKQVSSQQAIPKLHKDVNCANIMGRMAWKNITVKFPPPKSPPNQLLEEFTQFGESPISNLTYSVDFNPHKTTSRIFNRNNIEKLIRATKSGVSVNTYNDAGCVMNLLKKYRNKINGSESLVIGTLTPWLESMILANGARHVTTLEYGKLRLDHPQLSTFNPYSFAEDFLKGDAPQFDFGVSYSSLEHSGLGRYGDPINPYGDLEAMAQVWCMTKPGGMFMVGVPGNINGDSHILWNNHRVYGPSRLKHIAANWDVVDYKQCHDRYQHIILVLTKPLDS